MTINLYNTFAYYFIQRRKLCSIMFLQEDEYYLFQELQNGNIDAFDIIYDKNWNVVYRSVNNILKDEELSKDVVQETFIKLWEKRHTIKNNNIKGYLLTVSYHLLLKALKQKQKTSNITSVVNETNCTVTPQQIIEFKELNTVIEQCVAALPERCKDIYGLSRDEQLTNNEIALHFKLQPKTVENQITIALKRLKKAVNIHL